MSFITPPDRIVHVPARHDTDVVQTNNRTFVVPDNE